MGVETYTAGGREGVIDVEEADGILDGAVLERRDDSSCFGHCGAVVWKAGLF